MKVKKLYSDAIIPTYAHDDDAGMDLYSYTWDLLGVGERQLFPTGIAIEVPSGHFGLIRPRSGLATKHGIDTCSSNVIDAGYRGQVHVGLINHGQQDFMIERNMRIAQLLILPVWHVDIEIVDQLTETVRGDNGHGSTGVL